MMLGLKNILRTSTLSLLLSSVLLFAQNPKQTVLDDILNQVKKNSAFNDLDDDEKEYLINELNLRVSGYNKKGVADLLIEYDYSEDFANNQIKKIPTKLAGTPTVSIEELDNLLNMNIDDVLDEYIRTGILAKGFDKFKKEFDEIATIIKRGEEAKKRGEEAKKRGEEAKKRGEEAKKRGEELSNKIIKTKEIRKRLENIIKKINDMKKS